MIEALECIRCAHVWPFDLGIEYPYGCPACAEAGRNSNLFARYDHGPGIPYEKLPDLGQSDTPLFEFDGVLVKNEAANPTGSHKDRFAATAAAHAQALGRGRLVVGSSGNAGLSVAAFAAAAGLRCAVAGFTYLPETMRQWVRDFGADLNLFEKDTERTGWVRDQIGDEDNLIVTNIADPAIGSHWAGIEGYKAIAHEILREAGEIDHLVVPSSRGDLAWGIFLGFRESGRRIPRMHLTEPVPRLTAVLEGRAKVTDRFPGDPEAQWSISGDTTTVQALHAVTLSGGTASVVTGGEATDWANRVARKGLGLERSSAGVFAVHHQLKFRNLIRDGETTVLIATSHFYKGL